KSLSEECDHQVENDTYFLDYPTKNGFKMAEEVELMPDRKLKSYTRKNSSDHVMAQLGKFPFYSGIAMISLLLTGFHFMNVSLTVLQPAFVT
ncbi:MAG: hypothetical protein MHPSP_004200, partial [Paramarteilia canceri]